VSETAAIEAIAEEIDDRAETLDGIERSTEASATVFTRAGRTFAIADEGGFEFLVGEVIAAGALRTPDVIGAPRGPGWVRFSPAELDELALDRALAWFEAAWRRVGT
jgi:hypothetical protein